MKDAFARVRTIGLRLAGVETGTTYGSPALKRRGRMFACLAVHRSAEPRTLNVRVGFDSRDLLIASQPVVYYLTKHYVNYPVVLARLDALDDDALSGLIEMGWRFAGNDKPPRRRTKGS